MSVYEKFQQDLRDGAGISETLAKYNLTFKETFDYLHYPAKHNNMPSHDTRKVADYIIQSWWKIPCSPQNFKKSIRILW